MLPKALCRPVVLALHMFGCRLRLCPMRLSVPLMLEGADFTSPSANHGTLGTLLEHKSTRELAKTARKITVLGGPQQ